MAATAVRRLVYTALPVLYLLRNDLWFWNDGSRFLGLPVGLTYHLLFSAVVVLAMWWLVRTVWPAAELDRLATGAGTGEAPGGREGAMASPESAG